MVSDDGTNNSYSDDLDKANALGLYFENIHKSTSNLGDRLFTANINMLIHNNFEGNREPLSDCAGFDLHPFVNNLNDPPARTECPIPIPTDFTFQPRTNNFTQLNFIGSEEVQSIIKKKNTKKSAGIDNLSNYVIKKLSPNFILFITLLFNHMFNNGYWPKIWKNGMIMPLLKAGKNPNLLQSYRPITLLSCLSKVYESIIYTKILNYCDDNGVLSHEQFGFKAKHSTTHALTKLMHDVTVALNNRTPTIACSLDCFKAFDCTWTEGLLFKLQYLYGIHPHLCKIIYNFLTNRTFQVKIASTFSRHFNISAGVPQGAVLSPLLYLLYIADFPSASSSLIKKIFFADDIFIYCTLACQNTINNYLRSVFRYLCRWKIRVNEDKCSAIIFRGDSKSLSREVKKALNKIEIKINNRTIPFTPTIKYLGLIFSKNLKFNRHIDHMLGKVNAAFHSFRNVMFRKRGFSSRIKVIFYKQLLRPIITYGFPIWHSISSAQMERVRTCERKYLRACLQLYRRPNKRWFNSSTLYREAGVPRIDRHMIELAKNFFNNFQFVNNDLLQNTTSSHSNNYHLSNSNRFKSPMHLKSLLEENMLFDDAGDLVHYHQRSNRSNRGGLVYNTNQ